MAALTVSAVPYLWGKGVDGQITADGTTLAVTATAPVWGFYVLVTETDGTPKTGLKRDNFAIRVITQGHGSGLSAQSPVGPPVGGGPVALESVNEMSVPGVSGLYWVVVKDGELTPPSGIFTFGVEPPPFPAPIPYVFFVRVTIYSTRFPVIGRFAPAVQASGCTLASFAPDTDYTPPTQDIASWQGL